MKLRKLFVFLMAASFAGLSLSSCDDDSSDSTPAAPTVTAPATVTEGAADGTAVSITFGVNIPGGYASSSVTATGGTVSISSEPASGATSGDVVVSFTGTVTGAALVTITVTDNEGSSTTQNAAVQVNEEITLIEVNGNITSDVTWETGKTYILGGRISVVTDVTLTIEPGVVVKGQVGSGANASALVVARGAKIMAEGTATDPIIFTTVADNIEPGMITSPNLEPTVSGLWGGVIILGNAPISADAAEVQIEGIPVADTNGLYGGTVSNDDSGIFRYVSIRHGGANIGEGNEINGLTLGGVGSETVIEYVEIIGNQDDGVEPFGGSVDISNILVWNSGDDSFDCDQAYSGTIDNFIGILGAESDHGMELDGPEGTANADGAYTLSNGSIRGNSATDRGEYADLRSDAKCTIENVYFFDFKSNSDFELDGGDLNDDNDEDPDPDFSVSDNYKAGLITLSNLEFNVSHLTEGKTTIEAIFADKIDEFSTLVDENDDLLFPDAVGREAAFDLAVVGSATVVTSPTVGANKAMFTGWTWADADGQLDAFAD